MEEYIQEALAQQYIVPSTFYIFVEKNDGGLRQWIDYRGLNDILVKYLILSLWFPLHLKS